MMRYKKRYQHYRNYMDFMPGEGPRGMGGRGPMWGQGRRMRLRECWDIEDADTQRAWLEARKQRLQSLLAAVEEELNALDQENPTA